MNTVSLNNIEKAYSLIDKCLLNTPQYRSERLSDEAGASIISKVETMNPFGSFKGRGINWWVQCRKDITEIVAPTAGNLGQALAYEGRRSGITINLFVSEKANPIKVEAMRRLGAKIHVSGSDFDASKAAAIEYAGRYGFAFLEDGKDPEVSEGLGTIAIELEKYPVTFDVIYIPVGNGSLVNGIGSWYKQKHPESKIVGVCAEGAPSMQYSFKQKKIVSTDVVKTIADGIAVREPVAEALQLMNFTVDDVILVNEEEIFSAMKMYYDYESLIVEPTGAVSLAAALKNKVVNRGKTIGTLVTGSNIDAELKRRLSL